ncbi:MAG: amidohydrolase family protein, partial [Bacilli bacterium]|nr:amidohydrolase family protein [Bacilli bacterium]
MKIKGIANANIVFPDGVRKGNIEIIDGKIHLLPAAEQDGYLVLPENLYVAPGFVDEHIHGALGCDTMDASVEALENIASALPQEGVTSFLATTMTESVPAIEKSMEAVRQYMESNHAGAKIVGLHLEGPFISSKYKGSQAEENIRKPNAAHWSQKPLMSS